MKRTVFTKLLSIGLLVALIAGLFIALPGTDVRASVPTPPDYCIVSGITNPSAANGVYVHAGEAYFRPVYTFGVYAIETADAFTNLFSVFPAMWLRAFVPPPTQWYITISESQMLFYNPTSNFSPPVEPWSAIAGSGIPKVNCFYGTPPSTEPLPTPEPTKSPVTNVYGDGKQVNLSCKKTLSYSLIIPGGDMALLSCPVSGLGSNNKLTQEELPGGLPGGTFVSAMELEISGGGTPMILTPSPWIVTFKMPEGATADQLAILFWDKDNNQWVELPAAVNLLTDKFTDLGNGRKVLVGTHKYTRTHVSATLNFTGTFVLIKK